MTTDPKPLTDEERAQVEALCDDSRVGWLHETDHDRLVHYLTRALATIDALEAERVALTDMAAHYARNAEFYRGLLHQTAAHLGPEVYVSDDGSVQDTPLALKVPELVGVLVAERDQAQETNRCFHADFDAIVQACGAPDWEYRAQVVRDVQQLRQERDKAQGEHAELLRMYDIGSARLGKVHGERNALRARLTLLEGWLHEAERQRLRAEAAEACAQTLADTLARTEAREAELRIEVERLQATVRYHKDASKCVDPHCKRAHLLSGWKPSDPG